MGARKKYRLAVGGTLAALMVIAIGCGSSAQTIVRCSYRVVAGNPEGCEAYPVRDPAAVAHVQDCGADGLPPFVTRLCVQR